MVERRNLNIRQMYWEGHTAYKAEVNSDLKKIGPLDTSRMISNNVQKDERVLAVDFNIDKQDPLE